MKLVRALVSCWLLMWCASTACAQPDEMLRLTATQAQERLIRENLSLLVARQGFDAAKAQVMQARLLPNPYVQGEHSINRPRTADLYDARATSEWNITLTQLVELSGKRGRRIEIAELQSQQAEYAIYDLLRGLELQLATSLAINRQLTRSVEIIRVQLAAIENILSNLNQQVAKGNVSLNESTRLKAVAYSLQNQLLDLQHQQLAVDADIRVLLHIAPKQAYSIYTDSAQSASVSAYSIEVVLDSAMHCRYDLKAAQTQVELQQSALALQKAYRVPDLSVGLYYDRFAGAYINYTGLQVGLPLPVFNRNRGNIASTRALVLQSQSAAKDAEQRVQTEVSSAYLKALASEQLTTNQDPAFLADFDTLFSGVVQNYQKRNLSLLEFSDFFERYRQGKLDALQREYLLAVTRAELNYVIGKQLY